MTRTKPIAGPGDRVAQAPRAGRAGAGRAPRRQSVQASRAGAARTPRRRSAQAGAARAPRRQAGQAGAARAPRRQAGQAGMTLLEVLLATAILGFMLVMAWTTTSSVFEARQYFEDVQERNHEIRVALDRMAKDIASAYISGNEDENLDNRRTLFRGKDDRPVPELRFSSLAHRTLWANANESEQTWISYHAVQDRDDTRKTHLVRRESRRLSNEPWESEPAEADLLLRDIVRVEVEYFDPKDDDWQDTWDSTAADAERNRLPERVRITIVLEKGDREVEYSTQARPMLQEKLVF